MTRLAGTKSFMTRIISDARATSGETGPGRIELEGVRVHNLQNVTVGICRHALTVICGVSGSGKSSLAFDTLHAEGQRRYIETFSPYARQFLDRIERPDADRIDGIPPSVAIRQSQRRFGNRSTVGTRSEVLDYLRLLFVRAGSLTCPDCWIPVSSFSADSAAEWLIRHHAGRKAMLSLNWVDDRGDEKPSNGPKVQELLHRGFTRILQGNAIVRLDGLPDDQRLEIPVTIVFDRLTIEASKAERLRDSLETAFVAGDGDCVVFVETSGNQLTSDGEVAAGPAATARGDSADSRRDSGPSGMICLIDGRNWHRCRFSENLRCSRCGRLFAEPTPELLNYNSVSGACRTCEGTGSVSTMSWEKVVPDPRLSLRQGAIQPWNTPAYQHELEELLTLAADYRIPADEPFESLNQEQRNLIFNGIPERNFGGLKGFHQWLVRNRYKVGVRVFLNRWRSWSTCDSCRGTRLNDAAASIRCQGHTFSELAGMEIRALRAWLVERIDQLPHASRGPLRAVTEPLLLRLNFLLECGLGYLTCDRSMRTLSGGEAQRVMLTSALGSGLINTLYVLDEPSSGLHRDDTSKVIRAARNLTSAGNTVVVVEHDSEFILAADEVIEIGPAAGAQGGRIVFQGSPDELLKFGDSLTAAKLREQKQMPLSVTSRAPTPASLPAGTPAASPAQLPVRARRKVEHWLQVCGVNCHNIADLDVQLPLGVIGAVTGVSGSGKSSLIVDSLYPAVCRLKRQPCRMDGSGTVQEIRGLDRIDQAMLLDQSPLQKTSRSIPATWIGVFDEIRKLLADTHESRKRNYTAATFSFNSARGGRCPVCHGLGYVTIEMQFLADIRTTCEECGGRRFRPDVIEIRYRDRSVHDILEMTAGEAFAFFNGQRRIQQRLNAVRQAGLSYLRLGQPLSTLSGGEAQRLRIAALLAGVPMSEGEDAAENRKSPGIARAGRILFLLDEPSTGLHPQDIDQLMQCLDHLVQTGHSVLLIEHDDYLLARTDYVIEMGPGAGVEGGRVIQAG